MDSIIIVPSLPRLNFIRFVSKDRAAAAVNSIDSRIGMGT